MKNELFHIKPLLINFIKAIAELNQDYIVQDNILHRFNKNYKLSHYIKEVLLENPDGLHFREITKIILEKYGVEAPERKVHANLTKNSNFDQFINIGLGIYTLKGTGEYSGEKTPDIIYRFLKDSGIPKTVAEIQEYVSMRKKVEMKTIRVALDYPKEFRFCFYNDGKVGLREWNLGNERQKIHAKKYDISLNSALTEMISTGVIHHGMEFDRNELVELLRTTFPSKEITFNERALYSVLEKFIQSGLIRKRNTHDRNIYSLI